MFQPQKKDQARETLKTSDFSLPDSAVYTLFLQERSCHTHISRNILKQKSKHFHSQLYLDQKFKASDGWLEILGVFQ